MIRGLYEHEHNEEEHHIARHEVRGGHEHDKRDHRYTDGTDIMQVQFPVSIGSPASGEYDDEAKHLTF